MKPLKKPKYKFDPKKFQVKSDEDLTPEELYKEQLHSKLKLRRR
ncbi:MAG: hypothetical protein Q8O13_08370 [Candidatus Omnitrophota bacterium]|nr:hypothetical protein [Candidatus Omnitrophota bacterium]